MNDLKRRLEEDRSLRNTARSIVLDQFLRVREAASGKRIGEQLAHRISDDSIDAADRAVGTARKYGIAAAAIAAVAAALWFVREPIMRLATEALGSGDVDRDASDDTGQETED